MLIIHFVCRKHENFVTIVHPIYESGNWDLRPEEAEKLTGGMIYLHEMKAQASYFGGRIEGHRVIETDNAHIRRIVFTLTSMREAKNVAWRGTDHANAWTGGIVEVD